MGAGDDNAKRARRRLPPGARIEILVHAMRARAALLLLMTSAFTACSAKTMVAEINACEGGDADACELMAARHFLGEGVPRDESLGAMLTGRAAQLRYTACLNGNQRACDKIAARSGAIPLPKPAPSALDSAKGGAELVLSIELPDATSLVVNGKPLVDEAVLLAVAKKQLEAQPDTRAVIRADQRVPHGRVITVLDTLKQAG